MTESLMEQEMPTIGGFPDSYDRVPNLHRGVLALIEAQARKTDRAVDWLKLVSFVKSARRQSIAPYTEFPSSNLLPSIASVVNELRAFHLVNASSAGLSLSDRTHGELVNWNGQFKSMVATAREIIDRS